MKRASILLSLVMLLSLVGWVQADERALGVTLDTTFVSKYMWHGFNFYGHDNAAVQPSVNLDLWGTGFGAMVWGSWATKSGSRDLEEFNYVLNYGNSIFADTPYATNYTVNWLYFDYYDAPTRDSDLQELNAQLSWPDLLPAGIVPNYTVGKLWQARSGSAALTDVSGWVHVLGLGYDLSLPDLFPDMPEQVISLMTDLTYNGGYGAAAADHDWSHATLGASTSFSIAENLAFTPSIYYQISMDDSVNDEDEVWTTLSLAYAF